MGLNYILFDLETSGSKNVEDDIIEIAAIRVKNNIVEEKFYAKIDFGNEEENYRKYFFTNHIHKLDILEKNNFFPLQEVMKNFQIFCKKNPVMVAHNAKSFDIRFLKNACHKTRTPIFFNQAIDTYQVAKKIMPDHEKKFKLRSLLKHYGDPIHLLKSHNATHDLVGLLSLFTHLSRQCDINKFIFEC